MTKAERIRKLFQEGKSVSEIAEALGVTYQHAYKVLRRSGLLKPKKAQGFPENYEEFISGLEILGISLQALSARLDRHPQGKKGARLVLKPFGPEALEEGFRAGLALTVDLLDDNHPIGQLQVKLAATYRSPRFLDDNLFKVFAERNLPLNLWPYLRFYVDFLTTQMGLPPLTLPLFKV
ncbi:helix-turn-helix domain-containing protein [Meiothermus sp. PNK-Is4]|nr:sigma-70 family RNA polymerase sigma factor [Meiothermus sp. Pnk-1]RYM36179.1 helix-turn-helix domain-containing protein [Meiothermus sp. PNK-Is4]